MVEFDAADQEFALEQANFDMKLAEQEILKAQAEAAVKAADEEGALLEARFAVRRAELDARPTNSSARSSRKEPAARSTKRASGSRSSNKTSTAIGRPLRIRRRVGREAQQGTRGRGGRQRNIDNLRVRAPFDGFVSVRPNMMAFGGIFFGGPMPEYRVGDATSPAAHCRSDRHVSIEITAKLPEHDRANVSPGQTVDVPFDALPETNWQGSVRAVSSVASRQLFEGGGTRRFDISFDVRGDVSRIRPGVSAALVIAVRRSRMRSLFRGPPFLKWPESRRSMCERQLDSSREK